MRSNYRWSGKLSRCTWLLLATLALALPALAGDGPPKTKREPVTDILHGVKITDPYRWLEDQQSPETRAWIDAQNDYTKKMLEGFPGRARLEQRLTELMKVDAVGVPTERNGRYFFTKRAADQDLSVIYFRQGAEGEDQVLIDPHKLSEDQSISVNLQDVSEDGHLLVYGLRKGGEDEITPKVFDVDARKDLSDEMPRARYFGFSLTPDNAGFYYTYFSSETGSRVRYHKLGTDPAGDRELFGEGYDPGKIIFSELSDDGRYLLIFVLYGSAADKTEVYLKNVAEDGPIETVVNDIDARFFGGIAGGKLFLQTNWKAPNNRIVVADPANPAPEHWREVVPESRWPIDATEVAGGQIVVAYLQNVHSVVKLFTPEGKLVRTLALPSIGTVSGLSGRWGSDELFFTFESFHIPDTIYRYKVASGESSVWAKRKVPVDTTNFAVRQVWYPSKDGTLIPMFLVHQKGIRLDGNNPVYLTGYGGFDLSRTPVFSATATLWVESGGIYALPSLRGGGEFGEEWHRAGMLGKKQNVFDDFIAAAEWLIENGYTRPAKLAILGGSNGGLLVGAAVTQRPDLFGAVVCTYPLLDMLRYDKFLVARFWVPEYGSADDPEQFKYLLAYSPYQNVKPGTKYPAVLFVSGDSDTRVAPLHARKMTALMQAATGSKEPILLYYDTRAGHSGGRPISHVIEDWTVMFSFLFQQLGMTPTSAAAGGN
jgi:prolyl oligopeptidase